MNESEALAVNHPEIRRVHSEQCYTCSKRDREPQGLAQSHGVVKLRIFSAPDEIDGSRVGTLYFPGLRKGLFVPLLPQISPSLPTRKPSKTTLLESRRAEPVEAASNLD